MIDRIRRVLDERWLLDGRATYLIGVSGGADSIFLMHAMRAVCADRNVTCVVGHVNHGLRGQDSEDDAAFVREQAAALGLECRVENRDTGARCAQGDASLEMAARADRHEAFREMIAQSGADALVLAHHQGDQAETVLLQLCRSSGPDGFAGMPVQNHIKGMHIIRPLLGVSRGEIRAWLTEQHIPWREDASNADDRFLRNRMRAEVLPLLEARLNPAAERHIAEAAEHLQSALAYVDERAEQALMDQLEPDGELKIAAVCMPYIGHRILSKWLIRSGLPAERLSLAMLQKISRMCLSAEGSSGLDLGGGFRVDRTYDRLQLGCEDRPAPAAVKLEVPSAIELPDWGISVLCQVATGFRLESDPGPGNYPASVSLSATRLGDAGLQIRPWQAGDRMNPFGMKGTRKVQDILTDFKVPKHKRKTIPVLTVDDEIVYLQGYRVADDWTVESESHPAIRLTFTSL